VAYQCEECGYDYREVEPAEAVEGIRGLGRRYEAPLSRGLSGEVLDDTLRAHPIEGTWSALEYACHVRDVLTIQRERVALALVQDDFNPQPMDRDARVTRDRYNEQEPAVVAGQLAASGAGLADDFDALTPQQWERTIIYNFPERKVRSLEWVAVHTLHEGRHHLLDIGRVLRAARGR
jgi:predicted carbohydrate-binding protein with CBM5 and CBM33 domain